MSDHLLKAHLRFMLFIPAVMIFAIVYSSLNDVFSPAVCRETGEAPTEEFLFRKVYEVVFPDADFKEIHVEYAGWYFSRKVFVSGGSATLELDGDIEYGGFFNRNSNYLIGKGYYEISFRDQNFHGLSVTLDACGVAQDDIGDREMYRRFGKELIK